MPGFTELMNWGVAIAMLGWFALRLEPLLESFRRTIDRQSRALMILVMSQQGVPDANKKLAESLIDEIDLEMPRPRERAA